jgi:hypothetical protein
MKPIKFSVATGLAFTAAGHIVFFDVVHPPGGDRPEAPPLASIIAMTSAGPTGPVGPVFNTITDERIEKIAPLGPLTEVPSVEQHPSSVPFPPSAAVAGRHKV